MATTKAQIRLIFTVWEGDAVKETRSAFLGEITEDEILIKTNRPLIFKQNAFQSAMVKAIRGNKAYIVFYLDTFLDAAVEKEAGKATYLYRFKAPKEMVCNLQRFGLGTLTSPCQGYQKLYTMVHPKAKSK